MRKSDNGTFAPRFMGFQNPEPISLLIRNGLYSTKDKKQTDNLPFRLSARIHQK